MTFSKAFEKLIDAVREGRVTDAHLEAFVADPDQVLDADAPADADDLAPPRAVVSAEELSRRRAGLSEPVMHAGVALQRAEFDGDTYVVAGEEVWGPFEAAYDLQWADGKPLYRAGYDGMWQVFHGEEASTTYLAISSLRFDAGKPLFVAQLPTQRWAVVHGTTVYRDWEAVRTAPWIVEGQPLYIGSEGPSLRVAHGNKVWGGHPDRVRILGHTLIAGDPVYLAGDHDLHWGSRHVGWFQAVRSVLGERDGALVFVARTGAYDAPWGVHHGSRCVAFPIDPMGCELEGDAIRFVQEYRFPLSLFRKPRERRITLGLGGPPALPADAASGPYRKLPAKTGS